MKKTQTQAAAVVVEERSLLDQIVEATELTKIITVNRDALLENAERKMYYTDPKIDGPIEIQVFEKGKKTRLIKAMSLEIRGACALKYDPSKFTAPEGCGSVITTPKAVWMETTGRVEFTDTKGKTRVL